MVLARALFPLLWRVRHPVLQCLGAIAVVAQREPNSGSRVSLERVA